MSRILSGWKMVLILAGLSILTAVLAIRWSQQPALGTTTVKTIDGTDVKSSSSTQEALETSLFSTRISANFKMKSKNEVQSSSILGQYLLADKDIYVSDQLAITVGVTKAVTVNEVSPVQFRRTLPAEYIETDAVAGFPEGSVAFIKKADFEKSVFWVSNGKYVGVVVSGGIQNRASLEESLRTVVVNWTWK